MVLMKPLPKMFQAGKYSVISQRRVRQGDVSIMEHSNRIKITLNIDFICLAARPVMFISTADRFTVTHSSDEASDMRL